MSGLLEANGIAAFVSSKWSMRLGSIFTGAFEAGLWVVLDEQFDDALQLLNDPTHEVSRRLSQAEIANIRQSIQNGDKSVVLKVLFQLLLGALAFVALVFLLTRL